MIITEVFKKTTDNWCGNYIISDSHNQYEAVRVSFVELKNSGDEYMWRICVWGTDDCGMERDFIADEFHIARDLFSSILTWEYVTFDKLIKNGFISA